MILFTDVFIDKNYFIKQNYNSIIRKMFEWQIFNKFAEQIRSNRIYNEAQCLQFLKAKLSEDTLSNGYSNFYHHWLTQYI